MTTPASTDPSGATRAFADFAFGSRTQVADTSRPLAWLSPEEMDIDLSDPVARRFGDYELLEKIGQGGMGVVYRARQHGLERDVALKLLAAGPWASEEFVARFRREARSAARMQHPNIVEIYEFGHRDGLNYFSMRLIEGRSLAQQLQAGGPLPARAAATLLRTLAEAMDYAHRLGVLHLDLKPANVLLAPNGTPLIADFGLARRIDAGHDGSEEISGTPSYMAPEQAQLASHPLSASTDIYGLGAILYECLAGRAPFLGSDAHAVLERVIAEAPVAPRTLRRDCPRDLEAICLKCLAKAPAQRYATARALADDLQRFLDNRAVSVRPLTLPQRALRWSRREPRVAVAVFVAFAALAIGFAVATRQWREAEAQRNAALAAETAARAERDRAAIASEIGAHLFAYHGEDRPADLIQWLQQRLPGDEARQGDALAAFAGSVKAQPGVADSGNDLSNLVWAVITRLGVDYRHRMIATLLAGRDPDRHLYAAILAFSDQGGDGWAERVQHSLRDAVAERPNDPFTRYASAIYCPTPEPQACARTQVAEALVRMEPGNAYHWLLVAMWSTDPARRREALHEAARRTAYDDYLGRQYSASVEAIDAAAVPVPPLLVQAARVYLPSERPEMTLAMFTAYGAPIASWQELVRLCVPADLQTLDPALRADCVAIGSHLATTEKAALIARMIGVAIVRPLAPGTPAAQTALEVRRRYSYINAMSDTLTAAQRQRYPLGRWFRDHVAEGEMAAWQHQIEAAGMPGEPPADWQPEDPATLLSSRERLTHLTDMLAQASTQLDRREFSAADGLLRQGEAQMRDFASDWQKARYLTLQGRARIGLGDYGGAEKALLESWKLVAEGGPGSADTQACVAVLLELYTAWQRAEPDKGHEESIAEWRFRRDQLAASSAPRQGGRSPSRQ
jgi:hypothetical protein